MGKESHNIFKIWWLETIVMKKSFIICWVPQNIQCKTSLILEEDKRIKKHTWVVAYSLFQLPENDIMRLKILKIFLKKNKKFYFANENFIFSTKTI